MFYSEVENEDVLGQVYDTLCEKCPAAFTDYSDELRLMRRNNFRAMVDAVNERKVMN